MTVIHLDYYMQQPPSYNTGGHLEQQTVKKNMSIGVAIDSAQPESMGKKPGKRPGRKPSKIDEQAKLERSRQSARECRARKKLRYQYLEELVINREKAVFALRDELETCKQWCLMLDNGGPVPESLIKAIVTKETAQRNQQMRQAQQLLQRQLQQQQASPSSSSTSPPSQQSQHTPSPQSQGYLPNLSPPLQQAQCSVQQTQQPATGPTLRRQQAFDMSNVQDLPGASHLGELDFLMSHLPTTTAGHQMFQDNVASRQRNLQLGARVNSEPPFHYDNNQTAVYNSPAALNTPASNVQFRTRSSSNPSTLTSLPRTNISTIHTQGGSGVMSNTQGGSGVMSKPVQSLGLFSGTSVSRHIPSFVTADDGSSSDENIDGKDLFQFSTQNKRQLSDPVYPETSKRHEAVAPTQGFDLDTFVNITKFGFSSTSSSPMSYGMSPIRTASPSTLKYSGRLTPSSSAASSPAPSFSLSPNPSVMDYAQSPLTSYTYDKPSSNSQAIIPPTCIASDMAADTGLSASVLDSIHIGSYLDFGNENLPSLNSLLFQEDGSSQNFTRTETNNPPTPSFMNVPNIIDEFLGKN